MTLFELIEDLLNLAQEVNPTLTVSLELSGGIKVDPEILYASQPRWPFERQVGGPVLHDPMVAWDEEYGSECDPTDPNYQEWLAERALEQAKPKTVFLHEVGRQEYLRGNVATLLGWR